MELSLQMLDRFGGTHDIFLVSDYDSSSSGILGLFFDLLNCWEIFHIVKYYMHVYAISNLNRNVQIFKKRWRVWENILETYDIKNTRHTMLFCLWNDFETTSERHINF